MHYHIIINPICGRGRGAQLIPLIEDHMRNRNLEFEVVQTGGPWHAAELAKKAAEQGADVIVAAGGDGTANEVLNGIMTAKCKERPCMGILGIGRGNDFAFGMNVPQGVEQGVEILAANYKKDIDAGFVKGGLYPDGRYFGNGVGIGFDAVVGFEALKMTHLTGFASYAVAALKTVYLYDKPPLVRIEADSFETTQQILMVSIMNGRRMGGGFMMAPDGDTGDGLLNLCIAGKVGKWKIFPLIARFMKGTQSTHPAIKTVQGKRVHVTAMEGTLPAHADGETLCVEGKSLEIELVPSALKIVCEKLENPS